MRISHTIHRHSSTIITMEIPLKAKPKVSPVDPEAPVYTTDDSGYKLTRTYSETEVNNFDNETGHRLFDDELFRPKKVQIVDEKPPGVSKIYSRSHGRPSGIEDEYIPGLNFSDLVYQWGETPDLSRTNSYTSAVDLDDLHARVSPKVIERRQPRSLRTRAHVNSSDFEAILTSLPSDFNDMPYSQRKKLVKSINDSVDYSEFSMYIKNYFGKKTLANKLLSLTSDSKKLVPVNVDEKGARVMEFELGKVIGFGAWGTIRECYEPQGLLNSSQGLLNNGQGLNNVYAMKIVTSSAKPGKSILDVFRQEISIWQQMDHPGILLLIKHLDTEEAIFCVTRRINGGTLFEMVLNWGVYEREQPNPRRIALTGKYFGQVVDAIAYLHGSGIVHGDIKLENILVDKPGVDEANWRMIVCDFGMSRFYNKYKSETRSKSSMTEIRKPYRGESLNSRRLVNELGMGDYRSAERISYSRSNSPQKPSNLDDYMRQSHPVTTAYSPSASAASLESIRRFIHEVKTKETQRQQQLDLNLPDSHIGSLPYASPELLLPSPPPLGPSADIWALGILLYTMIDGRLPFQHVYEPRLRAMIIKGKYPALDDILQEFSEINDIIVGCLDPNITKRLDIDMVKRMMGGG